jgi:hypothetical protein
VQATLSAQFGGVPAWQPFTGSHVSTPLQNWPSLQFELFGVCVQVCVASMHTSSVHPTPSLQLNGGPAVQPLWASQISTPLQNTLSSQSELFGV